MLYTGGVRAGPRGPLLARVATAVHLPGHGSGVWVGPVRGVQTAQRGEVVAAAAAEAFICQPAVIVAGSRYARDGP
eukprot:11162510-Lingulodinium_polyedra.AAC.1